MSLTFINNPAILHSRLHSLLFIAVTARQRQGEDPDLPRMTSSSTFTQLPPLIGLNPTVESGADDDDVLNSLGITS